MPQVCLLTLELNTKTGYVHGSPASSGASGVCRLQKCSRSVVAMPAPLPLTRSLRWVAGMPMPSWYAHSFTVCVQGTDVVSRSTCYCLTNAWVLYDNIPTIIHIVARPLLQAVALTKKYKSPELEPLLQPCIKPLLQAAAVFLAATKHVACQADGCMCLQSV